jgi:hypothetical protein
MAAISTVTADFSNAAWTRGTAATIPTYPTRCEILMTGNSITVNNAHTTTSYDLTNSSFSFKNFQFPNGNLDFELRGSGASNTYRILGNASGTSAFSFSNANTTALGTTMPNATGKANPWWRWRHDGTNMIFEASSDRAFSTIGFTIQFVPTVATTPITALTPHFNENQTGQTGTWMVQEVNGAADPAASTAFILPNVSVYNRARRVRASNW